MASDAGESRGKVSSLALVPLPTSATATPSVSVVGERDNLSEASEPCEVGPRVHVPGTASVFQVKCYVAGCEIMVLRQPSKCFVCLIVGCLLFVVVVLCISISVITVTDVCNMHVNFNFNVLYSVSMSM